ncbi:MAG: glycosyltransferase family 2 protein, partial [Thermoleophilia bacterium]|nr:glycosyltransferase family 2 protein [Thermoleophilia bacterium]
MRVSAVVVSHGHARELAASLGAIAAQADEVVVIANRPGSLPAALPPGVRVVENERPLCFAANVNRGIAATTGRYVLTANPDAVPESGCVEALAALLDAHPQAGVAGPSLLWPDGTPQPSRRRFPTVRGTLARRTPLRLVRDPYRAQRAHYGLAEEPTEPIQSDWLLGAFLLQRRSMLDVLCGWDEGYRHYVEDIDLQYRAMRAGWERWYVPGAVARHDYAAV